MPGRPEPARGTRSDAAGQHHAERIPEEPRVLDRREELALTQSSAESAALAYERLREPTVVLPIEQRAGAAKKIVELVGVPRCRSQRGLHLLDRAQIEQLPKLLHAHQLAEQPAVERERLRAALLGRRIVLVHVRRDVVEEERGRERRGRRGLHLHEIELARLDPLQDLAEGGQVEDVLKALAIGLEHDRKLRVPARDLQQALRLQALLPERRPLAGRRRGMRRAREAFSRKREPKSADCASSRRTSSSISSGSSRRSESGGG